MLLFTLQEGKSKNLRTILFVQSENSLTFKIVHKKQGCIYSKKYINFCTPAASQAGSRIGIRLYFTDRGGLDPDPYFF